MTYRQLNGMHEWNKAVFLILFFFAKILQSLFYLALIFTEDKTVFVIQMANDKVLFHWSYGRWAFN